jgi:hypothetical protein
MTAGYCLFLLLLVLHAIARTKAELKVYTPQHKEKIATRIVFYDTGGRRGKNNQHQTENNKREQI